MWHVLLIKLNQAVVWMNSCLEQLSYHIKNWHHKKCRHHHNENIYWLVFNANFSSISAISLGKQILQINTSKKKLKGKKTILFRTYVIHWYKSNTLCLTFSDYHQSRQKQKLMQQQFKLQTHPLKNAEDFAIYRNLYFSKITSILNHFWDRWIKK